MLAGLQLPVTPFVEVPESAPGTAPWQYGPNAAKAGVTLALTVTGMMVVVAHWPPVGVNVYVAVPAPAVLILAGLQLPVIPLVEVP